MIWSCHPTTHGGIRSRLWASAVAFPKKCLTLLSDTRPLRWDVATANRHLRTRLKNFANFHDIGFFVKVTLVKSAFKQHSRTPPRKSENGTRQPTRCTHEADAIRRRRREG